MRVIKEINANNLINNVEATREVTGEKKIYAVVKSDAYGCGVKEVLDVIDKYDFIHYAVASIDEAKEVRALSWMKEIIVIGGFDMDRIKDIKDNNLTPGISSLSEAKLIEEYMKMEDEISNMPRINVHIKIDTGMNRLGFDARHEKEFKSDIEKILDMKFVKISGVFSHLYTEDEVEMKECEKRFDDALRIIEEVFKEKNKEDEFKEVTRHLLNTVGIETEYLKMYDAVRFGIGLYGYYPSKEVRDIWEEHHKKLLPILKVKSKLTFIRDVKKGDTISYGGRFTATSDMKVGVVESGYDDGYRREYSNRAFVKVNGHRCKVLGTVCMNLFMIDLTEVNAKPNDEVILMDEDITADELAKIAGTINYEVMCNFK